MEEKQKEDIKKLLKEGNYTNVRIVNISCTSMLSNIRKDKTSSLGGVEYDVGVSYDRDSINAEDLNEVVNNILNYIGMDNIICYKFKTNKIMKHLGSYFWSPVKDTNRDKLDIVIMSIEGRNNDARPLIDERIGWKVLKPEIVDLIRKEN